MSGIDLDSVAGLAGTSADNSGESAPEIDVTDLDLTALSAVNVTIPGGASVPLGELLELGAVNQYSEAADEGVSRAASGAVSDAGIVDTTGTGDFPADASLDLMALLPDTSAVEAANLTLGAVTGVAALDAANTDPIATDCNALSAPDHCRDYQIDSATIDMESPLLGDVVDTTHTALDALGVTLEGLSDEAVEGVLSGVTGALDEISTILPGVSLVSNDLTVSIDADLGAALDPILNADISGGGITLNAGSGTIDVDLEEFLDVNNLPPNTPLLSEATLTAIGDQVGDLLGDLQSQLDTALGGVLSNVGLTIGGDVCLAGGVGACTAGLNIAYDGTLADLLNGNEDLNISGTGGLALLNPILTSLVAAVTGALVDVLNPLVTDALDTAGAAITTVVANASEDLVPVFNLIGDVLSVDINVQEDDGNGKYTEIAARATLLGGTAVTVDLGEATVGPNELYVAEDVAIITPQNGEEITVPDGQTSTAVEVAGTGEPGADITLSIDGADYTTTVDGDGTWTVSVPGLEPGDYVATATQDADGQPSGDEVEFSVTAAENPDSNVNASASASASSNADDNSNASAQASAQAAALADASTTAEAAADANAAAAAQSSAKTDASTNAAADANGSAMAAAQAAALANSDDDTSAGGSTVGSVEGEANASAASQASSQAAAIADASTDASATASADSNANTNASASAAASANADDESNAAAQAAAQAAALSDSDTDASAAADANAASAAQSAADEDASTDASTDVSSDANAASSASAQAAANADNTSDTSADSSSAADANATSAAQAAAIADASSDASATAAADVDAEGSSAADADMNANASASAAASANADDESNAAAQAAAQAAALADATTTASAQTDTDATSAAQAAANADASSAASSDVSSDANASSASAAQAAAMADNTSDASADSSSAADANAASAAQAAAIADASSDASATAAADPGSSTPGDADGAGSGPLPGTGSSGNTPAILGAAVLLLLGAATVVVARRKQHN